MYYPNTNQIGANLGRNISPNYQSYIDQQVRALPQYLQLKESRAQNDAQLDLQKRSLDENIRQNRLSFNLAKDQADNARKQQLYGNLISGAGLGLNAYSALDEATGGDIVGGAKRALNSVLPSKSLADVASGVSKYTPSMTGSPQFNSLDQFGQNVSDWVQPASQMVNDWVVDPVAGGVKAVAQGVSGGAKKVGGAIQDAWTDVSGWVEGLFS